MMQKPLILALVLLALAACADRESGKDADGVIPRHQLDAMDRARNTEQVLQDAADRQREAMEQEGL